MFTWSQVLNHDVQRQFDSDASLIVIRCDDVIFMHDLSIYIYVLCYLDCREIKVKGNFARSLILLYKLCIAQILYMWLNLAVSTQISFIQGWLLLVFSLPPLNFHNFFTILNLIFFYFLEQNSFFSRL